MKLNPAFYIHRTENETVLVPLGGTEFSSVGKGNAILGVLLSFLEKETTEEELIAAMHARYDAPEDVIASDVRATLAKLREMGAIDE